MRKLKGWGLGLLFVMVVLVGSLWNKLHNVEQSAVSRAEVEALGELGNRFGKPLQDFFLANGRLARAGDRVTGMMNLPAYTKTWRLLENGIVEVEINPGWGITMRKVRLVPIVSSGRRITYLPAGKLSPEMRADSGNIEFLSDADIERQLALNKERISDALSGHGKVLFVPVQGSWCDGSCLRDTSCANARPLLCVSKSTRDLKGTGTDYRGTDLGQLTDADAICAEQFGPGWAVAKTNGINLGIGNAELMRNREYWVHYGMSAFENCWEVPD
jgi:hypothetical protein